MFFTHKALCRKAYVELDSLSEGDITRPEVSWEAVLCCKDVYHLVE